MRPEKTVKPKYIFVTGGVVSSLGKGLAAASIGALLEARGLRITLLKLDPYINVAPGTMNPFQHGEVYVTDDGAETDLDLGHYERYTSTRMGKKNNCTTGKIYHSVITKERRGDYLGGTVQVIPHITDEIKRVIYSAAQGFDLAIVEVGGTVGDIESLPFLEAIRQVRGDRGKENVLYVHVTLVPHIRTAGELKTKPTQHSVKELRSIGIQPDILLCRTDRSLPRDIKAKIALFCNVTEDAVITARDVDLIYEVPLVFHQEGLDDKIMELLNIWAGEPRLEAWAGVTEKWKNPVGEVTIAVVGKYVNLQESYKSLNEALTHGGIAHSVRVLHRYVDSEEVERQGAEALLRGADGILVPGGFGSRGVEGKIAAVRYARENRVPYFGICLGMQVAVLEFARNVCGMGTATSRELDPGSECPVIDLMPDQRQIQEKGATMRLGAYPCRLARDSFAHRAYRGPEVSERHRHRYEFNNEYREPLTAKGLRITGVSPDDRLVEIVEIADHPWFLGCQFHPEFQSRPMAPHPLFRDFIGAAIAYSRRGAVAEERSAAGKEASLRPVPGEAGR